MSNKSYIKKLERLEKIKNQIKKEEQRIERNIGKYFIKKFNLSYEESSVAKNMIDDFYIMYERDKKTNENKMSIVENNSSY